MLYLICCTWLKARRIALIIASGIQPIQNLAVLKYVGDEKKIEWGHYWIEKGFHSKCTELHNSDSLLIILLRVLALKI